jgi:hypothetical protein
VNLRRLLSNPQEVNFFLFLSAFALVIGAIYWFASYEVAGTLLLVGFGLATGIVGVRLALDPRAAAVRRHAARTTDRDDADRPAVPERRDPGGRGPAAEGSGGIDRPFVDEAGRLPAETLAPLAVGLGVALVTTGAIFGLAPVIVGLLPFAWGAWAWLHAASAELEATESSLEVLGARPIAALREDGHPVEGAASRGSADR